MIDYCDSSELRQLMAFIDENWKRGHIMASDEELIAFMHKNGESKFDIAIAKEESKIVGMLGLIRVARYDESLAKYRDIWLSMWKNIGEPGTGMDLYDLVTAGANTIGAIGINSVVAKLYKLLGYNIGFVNQYYILNPTMLNFKIAAIKDNIGNSKDSSQCLGMKLRRLDENEIINSRVDWCYVPRKTPEFFVNRYMRHPIYRYEVYGLEQDNRIHALFAMRTIECNGSRCLRLVDALGDIVHIGNVRVCFEALLQDLNAEYVDFLNAGLPKDDVVSCGWTDIESTDNIIPNYFEPFVQSNIKLQYAYKNSTSLPYVIFKGDSDQDRPNVR